MGNPDDEKLPLFTDALLCKNMTRPVRFDDPLGGVVEIEFHHLEKKYERFSDPNESPNQVSYAILLLNSKRTLCDLYNYMKGLQAS